MKRVDVLAALMLPFVFACTKENLVEDNTPQQKTDLLTVVVSQGSSASGESKAVFDDNLGMIWTPGGQAGLLEVRNTTQKPFGSKSMTVSDDKRQATFSFEVTGYDQYKSFYRLFYPYIEDTYPENVKFVVPAEQTQSVAGASSDIFCGMSKELRNFDPNNSAYEAVHFQAVGSYLKFMVRNSALDGDEAVNSITINSATGNIAGYYLVDAADVAGSHVPFTLTRVKGESSSIKISLDNPYQVAKEYADTKSVYASILPYKEGDGEQIDYVVKTTKGQYTFNMSNPQKYLYQQIKEVKLDLSRCNDFVQEGDPDALYLVGDFVGGGWDLAKTQKMERGKRSFTTTAYLKTISREGKTTINSEGFKFLTDPTDNSWYNGYVNGGYWNLVPREGNGDNKFLVETSGLYKIVADLANNTCSVVRMTPDNFYIWGSALGGYDTDKAQTMTKTGSTFTYTSDMTHGSFKFFTEKDKLEFTSFVRVKDTDNSIVLYENPTGSDYDNKFDVFFPGNYTVTVDYDAMTCETAINSLNNLYLVGSATVVGWDNSNPIEMKYDSSRNSYILENVPLIGGKPFKFLTTKGSWAGYFYKAADDFSLGYESTDSDNKKTFSVGENGYYDLTINCETHKVTLNKKECFQYEMVYNDGKETTDFLPTSDPNIFRIPRIIFGSDNKSHNFAAHQKSGDKYFYSKTSDWIAVQFDGPDRYTDPKYTNSASYKFSFEGSFESSAGAAKGCFVGDGYDKSVPYEVTLDVAKNTLTFQFVPSNTFWLVGDLSNWEKQNAYKKEGKEVSWDIETTRANSGFKIAGESEYYYSTNKYAGNINRFEFKSEWPDGYGMTLGVKIMNDVYFDNVNHGYDAWQFNDTGKYRITFNVTDLTIVVKKL